MKTQSRFHSVPACWTVVLLFAVLATAPRLDAATFVTQQAYLKALNTGAGDGLGNSVAISGDTIAVGIPGDDSGAIGVNGDAFDNSRTNSGAVAILVRAQGVWQQQAWLKASNPDMGDLFGAAVALDGDTLAVGAFWEDSAARGVNGDQTDNSATNSGAVYVFQRTGTNWAQQAYLKLSNTEGGEEFGRAVAISGDTIVAGAALEWSAATGVNGDQADNSAPVAGAAYVFVREGTNWTQQAYLKASNTEASDRFGDSVAIDGDTIAVGAVFEDSGATGANGNQFDNSITNSGAVYVFVRTATNWTQQAYLKASNPGTSIRSGFTIGDEFGTSVSVSGGTLVVGARNEASASAGINGDQSDNSLPLVGAAYVFARTGVTWTQQAYVKPVNPRLCSEFGWSVAALDEGRILVGARSERSKATGVNGDAFNFGALQSGAAYLFTRAAGTWSQAAYLKASNTETYDYFGVAVAGSGDTLLIGAPGEDSAAVGVNGNQADNTAPGAGAAYLFTSTLVPDLTLFRNSPGATVISWPSPSTGWYLQQNTVLNGGTWTTPPDTISDDGSTRSITINSSGGQRFFRLAQ